MFKFIELLRSSAKESKKVNALATTALLIALNLVLDKLTITITPDLRIGVGFLTTAAIGMFFGPVMGISAGFVTEIVSYLAYPKGGPYFPGFTITAMVAGFIYGSMLYKHKLTFWRALATKGCINFFCNICLNTLWLSMLQGKAIMVLLPLRILKNILLLPIEAIMLYMLCKIVFEIYGKAKRS